MDTFVFVHGAMHGAWCWAKVTPLIEQAGHKTIALDLPGHGENEVAKRQDVTLADYVDYIVATLDEQPEPVVLVAHSLGGISASQAVEYRPRKIRKLILLSAVVLENGTSLFPEGFQAPDWFNLPDAELKDKFYGDCSDADFRWARDRLVPQPEAPYYTKIHTTEINFGSVPKVYITCFQDRVIPPELQRQMFGRIPCEKIIPMDTSHSPFLSAPAELAAHLLSIIE